MITMCFSDILAVRYIALLAMVKIIPTHPHMIAEYQEEILQSLDDPDISIRMRALELISAMVRLYSSSSFTLLTSSRLIGRIFVLSSTSYSPTSHLPRRPLLYRQLPPPWLRWQILLLLRSPNPLPPPPLASP